MPAVQSTEPAAIGLRIVPTDIDHRMFTASPALVVGEGKAVCLAKRIVFFKGDGVATQCKGGNVHVTRRAFVEGATAFHIIASLQPAHEKTTRWNVDHAGQGEGAIVVG